MSAKRYSDEFDLPMPKFLITDAFKVIKQIPLETSSDMFDYYNKILNQKEKLLLFKQVLQVFDASSYGYEPIDQYCAEMFHAIWLTLKNAIEDTETTTQWNGFFSTIENIKNLDDSAKALTWISTLENFTIFKTEFAGHVKIVDLTVKLHPKMHMDVYRFLTCINNKDSNLYSLKHFEYLMSIIIKLKNYDAVLQNIIFMSIRQYFFESEHNLLNLEKFSFWLDNNIYNFEFSKWDWIHFAIKTNEETKKELDFKNTFKNILPFYDQKQELNTLKTFAFDQISSPPAVNFIFKHFHLQKFKKI